MSNFTQLRCPGDLEGLHLRRHLETRDFRGRYSGSVALCRRVSPGQGALDMFTQGSPVPKEVAESCSGGVAMAPPRGRSVESRPPPHSLVGSFFPPAVELRPAPLCRQMGRAESLERMARFHPGVFKPLGPRDEPMRLPSGAWMYGGEGVELW